MVTGAPIVCLIGASYVTGVTGGGAAGPGRGASALLLTVLILAAAGLRASSGAQLGLVGLLMAVITVAAAGSAASERASHWVPFAPHGWLAVGHAAATLMLSFVGWGAVAPLTARFANPARQLPRVVAIALAVTTALYLGLAIATIGVLGPHAGTAVPLAGLLRHAAGAAGPAAAACAAVGLLLIALYAARLVNTVPLVAVPTVLFLCVYLASMAAATRVLRGPARWAAVPAGLAVIVMLGYCGWALAVPAAVALAAARPRRYRAGGEPARTAGSPPGDRYPAGLRTPTRPSA